MTGAHAWDDGPTPEHEGRPDARNIDHLVRVLTAGLWGGVLAYDSFAQTVVLRRAPPGDAIWDGPREMTEIDVLWALQWFHANNLARVRKELLFDAMIVAAHLDTFHPVKDYFARVRQGDAPAEVPSTVNGGKVNSDLPECDALSLLLTLGFGAEDTALNRAISRAFMVAMVRRVREPGSKHDHLLVLIGEQGIKKSTGLRTLVGADWFANSMPDLRSKDAALQLRGKLLIEWSEMEAASRATAARIKNFLASQQDTYRAPYGRITQTVPRVCSFAGTSNGDEVVDDPSGARRYWPAICSTVDLDWIAANRDLLWRLACGAEDLGEANWVAAEDLRAELGERQSEAQHTDVWTVPVLTHAKPGMTLDSDFLGRFLNVDIKDQHNGHQQRVAGILRKAGWVKVRQRMDGARTVRWYPKGELQV